MLIKTKHAKTSPRTKNLHWNWGWSWEVISDWSVAVLISCVRQAVGLAVISLKQTKFN